MKVLAIRHISVSLLAPSVLILQKRSTLGDRKVFA